MFKKIKELKNKFVKNKFVRSVSFYIYVYWLISIKKTDKIIGVICKIYEFVWKRIKKIIIKVLKILYVTFIHLKYYFFKLKLHLYDRAFCKTVYFIWVNFGFRWIFYNVLNHYHWNGLLAYWWFYLPDHLYYLVTDEYYYKIKIFLWHFKRKVRKLKKKEAFYIKKYKSFFASRKKDFLKSCFYAFLCLFVILFFIKFILINMLSARFFLLFERIVFFVISSIKYFVLFLKFKCYFFFLKHSNKFNLNKKYKRRYKWRKTFLKEKYFHDTNAFDFNSFYLMLKSIMKTRNIFYYYKFRNDLNWYSYEKKTDLHETNLYYNRILYRLLNKHKWFSRKQRWVIWLQNLWIYSINFNFFYFYKLFFFFFNYVYFSIAFVSNVYLELYLEFIIYLSI